MLIVSQFLSINYLKKKFFISIEEIFEQFIAESAFISIYECMQQQSDINITILTKQN
jgi:hypothetical protein